MATPPIPKRITGKSLRLTIGDVDYQANVSSYSLESEDADDSALTFYDASLGGARDWTLKLTALQSTDPNSLWRWIWEHAGEEISYTIAPHGNETPTSDQPHLTGRCIVPAKPNLGGDAGKGNVFTFESEFSCVGGPELLATSSAKGV